jgi:hypothetical protein
MFSSYFGDGFYGNDDHGVTSRDCWNEKSQAAIRRQTEAINLFEEFLSKCRSLTQFPVTEEVVPATTHLTGPCWNDFRRHVESKGCHAKRKEATLQEREKDKRKGKMYVISITVPVHPSQAVAVAEEQHKKAEENAKKRKERAAIIEAQKKEEQKRTEKKRRLEEAERQASIAAQYQAIVNGAKKPPAVTIDAKPVTQNPEVAQVLSESTPSAIPSAIPSAKLAPAQTSSQLVSPTDLLQHAEKVCRDKMKDIAVSIATEKQDFLKELTTKKQRLETEVMAKYKNDKQSLLDSLAPSLTCCSCQKAIKLPAAKWVTDDCRNKVCADCLKRKIADSHKCTVCTGAFGTSQPAAVQNIKCPECIKKIPKGGYFQFDYCRDDCGFICPDHTHEEECCVCGCQTFCTNCEIPSCGRCGENLCHRCSSKEGCMCDDKSERELWGGGDFW